MWRRNSHKGGRSIRFPHWCLHQLMYSRRHSSPFTPTFLLHHLLSELSSHSSHPLFTESERRASRPQGSMEGGSGWGGGVWEGWSSLISIKRWNNRAIEAKIAPTGRWWKMWVVDQTYQWLIEEQLNIQYVGWSRLNMVRVLGEADSAYFTYGWEASREIKEEPQGRKPPMMKLQRVKKEKQFIWCICSLCACVCVVLLCENRMHETSTKVGVKGFHSAEFDACKSLHRRQIFRQFNLIQI